LLLLTTMMSAQPPAADVPVIGQVRRPCEATADGPRRPTIVGRDGRFDQRCYDPKVEALKVFAQVAGPKARGTFRIPFNGRHR
jgi:hypothetical protein